MKRANFAQAAWLSLLLAGQITAQNFTTIYSFTATSGPDPSTNCDGANPLAGVILSGNTLYGTAILGENSGNGAVFKVNTDSTGFTALHSFTALSAPDPLSPVESKCTACGRIKMYHPDGFDLVF